LSEELDFNLDLTIQARTTCYKNGLLIHKNISTTSQDFASDESNLSENSVSSKHNSKLSPKNCQGDIKQAEMICNDDFVASNQQHCLNYGLFS
jgi:hypothetical protein